MVLYQKLPNHHKSYNKYYNNVSNKITNELTNNTIETIIIDNKLNLVLII